MNFLIADTFIASFNKLSGLDQKAVKASVFDLQMDPTGNGLQLHRIDESKDENFWSARVLLPDTLLVHATSPNEVAITYSLPIEFATERFETFQRQKLRAKKYEGDLCPNCGCVLQSQNGFSMRCSNCEGSY